MSIHTSSTNYMSNATILEWMETKTEGLYSKMRASMDQSNNRVAAEDALNDLKGKIDDLKASGADAGPLRDQIEEAIAQHGAEFPEVGEVLQPIANELTQRIEDALLKRVAPTAPPNHATTRSNTHGNSPPAHPSSAKTNVGKSTHSHSTKVELPPVKISKDDAERWTKQITDKVDTLGKEDQLGMIHLQEFNAQLNRTKDTASALMASANKAADNIVSHIS
jgi:hypothetical protein